MTDRLIRITTARAVVTVASVAAIISHRHACELVTSHGEIGLTYAGERIRVQLAAASCAELSLVGTGRPAADRPSTRGLRIGGEVILCWISGSARIRWAN